MLQLVRRVGLATVAWGLLVYLALPRRRLPTATIRYPGWRVVLTDVVWLLVFVPFFALPVLIVGAFQPALMAWPALTAVFWLFACAGLILLSIAALAAAGVAFRPEVEERRDFWPPTIVRG